MIHGHAVSTFHLNTRDFTETYCELYGLPCLRREGVSLKGLGWRFLTLTERALPVTHSIDDQWQAKGTVGVAQLTRNVHIFCPGKSWNSEFMLQAGNKVSSAVKPRYFIEDYSPQRVVDLPYTYFFLKETWILCLICAESSQLF